MADDPNSPRKPFGERDADERKLPFGARPPVRPDTPYEKPPRRPASEESARHSSPPHEPDAPQTVDVEELAPFKPRTAPSEAQVDQRYSERVSTRIEDVMGGNGDESLHENSNGVF